MLYLSTIGAQTKQTTVLSQLTIGEFIFGQLEIPVIYLRRAWFIENTAWDIVSARNNGVMHSFLQPLDKPVPMVTVELVQENWTGQRVVELEGPSRTAPLGLGEALSKILKHQVRVEAVPRDSWEGLLVGQGMRSLNPRIRMIDGFNEGWIDFANGFAGTRRDRRLPIPSSARYPETLTRADKRQDLKSK